jgi:DNA-binding LytR/AlgR family response regulator
MNCIIIDDDKISTEILLKQLENFAEITVQQTFENPVEAMSFLSQNDMDLVFLDVEMPQITGMQFIEIMGDRMPATILTTSHENFAVEAFKYNVTGYLLKPVNFEELSKTLIKAINIFRNSRILQKNKDVFFVKSGSTIERFKKEDLILIECIGNYANVITKNKTYTIQTTMKELERKLGNDDFLRVHRTFIVRKDAIENIQDNTIIFKNKQIPIGKTYRQHVYSSITIL